MPPLLEFLQANKLEAHHAAARQDRRAEPDPHDRRPLAGEGRARVTERCGVGSRAARVIIFAIELCT